MSSIEKGVFFLNVNERFVDAPALPIFAADTEDSSSAPAVLYVFFVFFLLAAVGIAYTLYTDAKKEKEANGNSEGRVHQATL